VAQAQAAYEKATQPPTSISQTTPLNAKPGTGSIVYLVTTDPDNVEISQAVQEAAKAAGWQYSQLSYDAAAPASLQAAFNNALTKHPTAVAECGAPPSLFGQSVINAYQAAKVTIIVSCAPTIDNTSYMIGTPDGSSNDQAHATMMANWFTADSNGKGKALVVAVPGFPILNQFTDTFSSLVKTECPGCSTSTVNVTIPQVTSGQLISVVVQKLKADQSIKYAIIADGAFADGINSALSAAGLNNVKIGGQDAGKEQLAETAANKQAAWTVHSNYLIGYEIVDLALRHAEGMAIEPAAGQLQTQLILPSNVGSLQTWNKPTDALAQYEKLWQVAPTPCTLGCNG
jgi:ribose transport system substrate-binding protein